MLHSQILERREQTKKRQLEKESLHRDIQQAVLEDQRAKQRAIIQRNRKVIEGKYIYTLFCINYHIEKANRDQQVSLKNKAKLMEQREAKIREQQMLEKLKEQIEEEKQRNLDRKIQELNEHK